MRMQAVCWGLAAGLVLASPVWAGDIDLGLQEVLAAAKADQTVSTIVYLNAQVDIDQLNASLGAVRAPKALRHEVVVRALQSTAELSRGGFEDYIQRLSDAGQIERFESFWIVNAFRVDAAPEVILQIAKHADVKSVYFNYEIMNIEPVKADASPSPARGTDTPEPGLVAINVPQVWALGYHGEGVLVSTLDTGVAGNHPALASRWRGLDPNYAGHPGWAFFDPVTSWTFPQDSGSHGTHTMGTICGGAPGDEVGVAPGAQWIHAAVIDRVSLLQTCTDAILSFQWLIDPDGNPSTTYDVPNTNSNSWGIGTWHNVPPYNSPCDPSFWSYIDACEAAGTVVFFSSGNEGPDANSHRRPADRATDDYRACSVGAVDGNQSALPIAGFSSRGPTYCTPNYPPGDAFIKPNISAPGVDVRSSVPGGSYSTMSGTSMASPHVNGVAALMCQACPDLTPDEIKQAMYDTAMDKGAPGKDNDYGWGVIDALAAVQRAIALCISSEGKIDLDRSIYACEDTAELVVRDLDLNTNPNVIETVSITVVSTSEPAGETLVLTETDPNSARFEGSLALSATNSSGVLQVSNGDTVTATYIDADNGLGGHNIPVTDTATVDCVAPVISNVQVTNIQAHSATVTFATDELARGIVHYGLDCGNLNQTATAASFSTTPSVNLTGLLDNTTYYFMVEAEDQAGNGGSDPNCYTFATPEVADYFTQLFDTEQFDLDNVSLKFTPLGGVDFYSACVETQVNVLPTDPNGGTPLTLTDDSYVQITLSGGAQVYLYGTAYNTFYVGSNGYVTFGSSDTAYTETFALHFGKARVAALLDDLNPAAGGQVSWRQLADHAAVTWWNVAEYGTTNQNTFQIELFFDGRITISYLSVAVIDGLAGLSRGLGVPPDFFETDLSAVGSCGPRPPYAGGSNVVVPVNTPYNVTLIATDDGLPDPPAALTFRIKALPQHGDLTDAGNGQPINAVPYDLVNHGNAVVYTPDLGYYSTDSFQFAADDGGAPPEGGESNTATISISVEYGPPVIATTALPDGCLDRTYSYQMQVSQGQPPLTWALVSTGGYLEGDLGSSLFAAVGTAKNWKSDDGSWPYTLPFTFPYFGTNYGTVNVCSNGFLDFTSTATPYGNSDALLLAAVRIAPMWDDLMTNQNASDDIFIDESVSGQVTIRWRGVTFASPRTPVNVSVTLYADGRIQFHYGANNTNLSPTIGVSNGDSTNYTLSTYNNATSLTNANSHEFAQLPALPSNITLSPSGLLSGIPIQTGTFYPRIKVTDALNRSDEELFTLVIDAECTLLGDLNCDGVVNFDDINPFIDALSDPAYYHQQYPDCNILNGDCTNDGAVTFDDINCFVDLLGGGK